MTNIFTPIRAEMYANDDKGGQRFWNIELDGDTTEVHFGKAGSKGRKIQKVHDSVETAKKFFDKMIAAKTKDGYDEGIPDDGYEEDDNAPVPEPVAQPKIERLSDALGPRVVLPPSAGTVRLEFVEGTSSKFWQIELRGTLTVVTFGRIGSKGRELVKEHGTLGACMRFFDKMIAEKKRGGYKVAKQQPTTVTPAKKPPSADVKARADAALKAARERAAARPKVAAAEKQMAQAKFDEMRINEREKDVLTTDTLVTDVTQYKPRQNDFPGVDTAGAKVHAAPWELQEGDETDLVGWGQMKGRTFVNWYGEVGGVSVTGPLRYEPERTWTISFKNVALGKGDVSVGIMSKDSVLYRSTHVEGYDSAITKKWFTTRRIALEYNSQHYGSGDDPTRDAKDKQVQAFDAQQPLKLLNMNDAHTIRTLMVLARKDGKIDTEHFKYAFQPHADNKAVTRNSFIEYDDEVCAWMERTRLPKWFDGWIWLKLPGGSHHDEIYMFNPTSVLKRRRLVLRELKAASVVENGQLKFIERDTFELAKEEKIRRREEWARAHEADKKDLQQLIDKKDYAQIDSARQLYKQLIAHKDKQWDRKNNEELLAMANKAMPNDTDDEMKKKRLETRTRTAEDMILLYRNSPTLGNEYLLRDYLAGLERVEKTITSDNWREAAFYRDFIARIKKVLKQ